MTTAPPTEAPTRADLTPLLTVADLERLLKVDRRTIARLCKAGRFPRPIRLGGQNRWKPDQVRAAIRGED